MGVKVREFVDLVLAAAALTAVTVIPPMADMLLRDRNGRRRITPWLSASGLAEVEVLYQDFDAKGGTSDDTGRREPGSERRCSC